MKNIVGTIYKLTEMIMYQTSVGLICFSSNSAKSVVSRSPSSGTSSNLKNIAFSKSFLPDFW